MDYWSLIVSELNLNIYVHQNQSKEEKQGLCDVFKAAKAFVFKRLKKSALAAVHLFLF